MVTEAAFLYHERVFDPLDDEFPDAIYDLVAGDRLWKKTGFVRYEFLARQLPILSLKPALTWKEAKAQLNVDAGEGEIFVHNKVQYLSVNVGSERYVVPMSEMWVIGTRPDFENTELNPRYDLVRYGLKNGQLIFETSCDGDASAGCSPSADTRLIVTHALANAIIASVLARQEPGSPFFNRLKNRGMAMAHWHGFLSEANLPLGYFVHDTESQNAPCSTHSIIHAMQGKLGMLHESAVKGVYPQGDIQIEPHHGTTINCPSLEMVLHRIAIGN